MSNLTRIIKTPWFPLLGAVFLPVLYLFEIYLLGSYDSLITPVSVAGWVYILDVFLITQFESALIQITAILLAWSLGGLILFWLIKVVYLISEKTWKRVFFLLILWFALTFIGASAQNIITQCLSLREAEFRHIITREVIIKSVCSHDPIGFRRLDPVGFRKL